MKMAEMAGVQIPTFDWDDEDPPGAFRKFKQYVDHVFKGPLCEKPKEVQASYILLWLGPVGIDLIHTFDMTDAEKQDPQKILDRFTTHFAPKTNFRLARFNLQRMQQGSGETVDDYVARLRLQSDKCKFTDIERPHRILEQLIFGSSHPKVQEKMLVKGEDFTLDQAIDLCRTYEANRQHMADFKEEGQAGKATVHMMNKTKEVKCRYCSRTHEASRKACPALNPECGKCGKIGHWAAACRTPTTDSSNQRHQGQSRQNTGQRRYSRRPPQGHGNRVAELNTREDEEEHLYFDALCTAQARSEAFADLQVRINGVPGCHTFHAKVDTGADGNILPARCLSKMPSEVQLDKEKTKITAYNGTEIRQMGTMEVECTFNGNTSTQKFHVVDCDGPILIGLPACEELDLIRLNRKVHMVKSEGRNDVSANEILTDTQQLIEQYPAQFQGLGKFPGTASIEIDPTVKPVVHPPRKCPIHLRDDLKKELDKMESMGVIKPTQEPTDWVSSLVIAKKPDGKLRICLDPRDLNKAIKRPHHRNITTEELTHQLAGATVFSKLDARSGYWAIQLDEQSSKLTTFNSPFGRYSFCRLPFGIRLSQDLFQRKMDEILAGLEGVINIADDICVFGKDASEHTQRLRALMQRARDMGLVFNPDKCAISLSQVSFFGHVYSANGISPDPAKVDAIQNIERPKTVAELQSFLGMCTYLSPFIPGFSELTHHLRQMLKENAIVEWSPQAAKDFQTLKNVISSDTVLAFYDPPGP